MKTTLLLRHVWTDLAARRGRSEMLSGMLAVAVIACAYCFVLAFTNGLDEFVEHCYRRARPVIGTLRIRHQSGKTITARQKDELEELAKVHKDEIEEITWVSQLDGFGRDFRQAPGKEFSMSPPVVWSIPSTSLLFDSEYGVRFFSGKPLDTGPHDDLRLSFLCNITFLEDYFDLKEKEKIELLLEKRKPPREQCYHIPPISAEPEDFASADRMLPVSGYFVLPEGGFPHILVSEEVAAAFYYRGDEDWNPSYALSFADAEGRPLATRDEVARQNLALEENEVVALPSRDRLLKGDDLFGDKGKTRYQLALVFARNYRDKDSRSRVKDLIEQARHCKTSSLTPGEGQAVKNLDRHTIEKLMTTNPDSIALDSRWEVTPSPNDETLLLKNIDDSFNTTDEYILSFQNNSFIVHKKSPWKVDIPSDMAMKAIGRMISGVNKYSTVVLCILLVITAFVSGNMGFVHIHLRRSDIGLLKANAMGPWTVAVLFCLEPALIALIGFGVGFVLFQLVSIFGLEQGARQFVQSLSADYTWSQRVLVVGLPEALRVLRNVMLGFALGMIVPTVKAMLIEPDAELRTAL